MRRGCAHAVRGGLAVAGATLLAGCGLIGGNVRLDVPNVITVTSPDVTSGVLNAAYSCGDPGKNPGLHWSGVPQAAHRTRSIAVVMDDSGAPITPYIYWIAFNISPETTDILPGVLPSGVRQAFNSKGTPGYDPPCPRNEGHSYRITVYALSRMLNLPNGAGLKSAWSAIAQYAIARGRLPVDVKP